MPQEVVLLGRSTATPATDYSGNYLPLVHADQHLTVANYVWDTIALDWVVETQPGSSGGGGGGAVTVADGADVTQGAKADAVWDGTASAPTAQSIFKYLGAKIEAVRALLAGSITVTGTFFQATQPVSLASAPTTAVTNAGLTNLDVALSTRLKPADTLAAVTAITNPVTANQGSANATPWNENIAQVGGAAVSLGVKVSASSIPVVVASDQGAFNVQHGLTGATNVMKTGTLTSVAVTADQVVLTYTVTSAKTFYLQYVVMYGRLTAVSATASILGAISLETPSGTKVITLDDVNPTTSECFQEVITFSEPQPIAAGVVVRVVVTPAATTSMLWRANFGGYEK